MKTFALLLTLTLVQLFSELSQAYILPIETILNKTVATASAGILSIEQNVIFKEAGKDYIIKEEWLIEGDKNLKLTATGLGELKDLFKVTYLYNNKTRSFLKGKNKITSEIAKDFFEKYLAIKSTASYLAYLQNMNVSQKVSYSRATGSICFAIGEAATPTLSPAQIWIDQDLFQLKKMRFNSTAEVEFADYKLYEKTYYPTRKIISVNDDSVNINVIKVALANSASIKDFYPESLSSPSEINLSSKEAVGLKIENFYTRFR